MTPETENQDCLDVFFVMAWWCGGVMLVGFIFGGSISLLGGQDKTDTHI